MAPNFLPNSYYGMQIYSPPKLVIVRRIHIPFDFIRSGIYKRYQRLITKAKTPIFIFNWLMTILIAMLPFTVLITLMIKYPILQIYNFWLFILAFELAWIFVLWAEELLPRTYKDIKLKRKHYDEYF